LTWVFISVETCMKLCKDFAPDFAAYLDGELDLQTQQELAEHLKTCSACQEDLKTLEQAWQMLDPIVEEQPSVNTAHFIRQFYTKTLPSSLMREFAKPNSLWIYTKSIAAGILCGLSIFWGFFYEPEAEMELEMRLWANPDFEIILQLELLENYEVFEHFTVESLQSP